MIDDITPVADVNAAPPVERQYEDLLSAVSGIVWEADGETMRLDRYDATIAFFDATPPRSECETLEIVDINPDTGLSGEGIPNLLGKIAERRQS